tara:strand:- start:3194 stop:3574 length:381 start_codon:yes stop_codon:yes gene_type:complete
MAKNKVTLSFIPYADISRLNSVDRVKRVLDIVLKNRIVILQGRLDSTEEASLIQSTMALVGKIKRFKGVELAVIQPNIKNGFFDKMKLGMARALVGQRDVLTIVGPASIVKDIKKDPSKIDLMLKR